MNPRLTAFAGLVPWVVVLSIVFALDRRRQPAPPAVRKPHPPLGDAGADPDRPGSAVIPFDSAVTIDSHGAWKRGL